MEDSSSPRPQPRTHAHGSASVISAQYTMMAKANPMAAMFAAAKTNGKRFSALAPTLPTLVASARDNEGSTPLHWCALRGDTASIALCLQHGIAVDAINNAGQTALMWAVIQGHVDAVSLLIESGANVNARDSLGATPLILATQYAQNLAWLLLLDRGAAPALGDNSSCTTAHWAAFTGNATVLEMLHLRGFDLRGSDGEGCQPLHRAARGGKLDAMRFLVETAGIDPRSRLRAPSSTAERDGDLGLNEIEPGIDTRSALGQAIDTLRLMVSSAQSQGGTYAGPQAAELLRSQRAVVSFLRDAVAEVDAAEQSKMGAMKVFVRKRILSDGRLQARLLAPLAFIILAMVSVSYLIAFSRARLLSPITAVACGLFALATLAFYWRVHTSDAGARDPYGHLGPDQFPRVSLIRRAKESVNSGTLGRVLARARHFVSRNLRAAARSTASGSSGIGVGVAGPYLSIPRSTPSSTSSQDDDDDDETGDAEAGLGRHSSQAIDEGEEADDTGIMVGPASTSHRRGNGAVGGTKDADSTPIARLLRDVGQDVEEGILAWTRSAASIRSSSNGDNHVAAPPSVPHGQQQAPALNGSAPDATAANASGLVAATPSPVVRLRDIELEADAHAWSGGVQTTNPSSNPRSIVPGAPVGSVAAGVRDRICFKCGILQPFGSVHDDVSGRCYNGYDHFNVWAGNVVAASNRADYVVLLALQLCFSVLFVWSAVLYANTEKVLLNVSALDALMASPLLFVSFLLHTLIGLRCFNALRSQYASIGKGLTSYEADHMGDGALIHFHSIALDGADDDVHGQLHGASATPPPPPTLVPEFHNPFSHGSASANLSQFYSSWSFSRRSVAPSIRPAPSMATVTQRQAAEVLRCAQAMKRHMDQQMQHMQPLAGPLAGRNMSASSTEPGRGRAGSGASSVSNGDNHAQAHGAPVPLPQYSRHGHGHNSHAATQSPAAQLEQVRRRVMMMRIQMEAHGLWKAKLQQQKLEEAQQSYSAQLKRKISGLLSHAHNHAHGGGGGGGGGHGHSHGGQPCDGHHDTGSGPSQPQRGASNRHDDAGISHGHSHGAGATHGSHNSGNAIADGSRSTAGSRFSDASAASRFEHGANAAGEGRD